MDWHHLIYNTYVCLLQPFLLVQLSALRLVDISCCLAPDNVSATEHFASPVLLRGTACHPTFELHQHPAVYLFSVLCLSSFLPLLPYPSPTSVIRCCFLVGDTSCTECKILVDPIQWTVENMLCDRL